MLGTMVIMFYVFSLPKNSDPNSISKGLVYSVVGLVSAFGANCGAPFNPAADFCGR
jgi:glycerol uptake facilitator-like aquaporin